MINSDKKALQALGRHVASGKTGHPHAVRRYCQRGLDLQNSQEYFIYLSHKAYLVWSLRMRGLALPFSVFKSQVEQQSGGTLTSIVAVHDELQVGITLPGTFREIEFEGTFVL